MKHLKRQCSKPFLCSSGCLLKAAILLEWESPTLSQAFAQPPPVSINFDQFLCSWPGNSVSFSWHILDCSGWTCRPKVIFLSYLRCKFWHLLESYLLPSFWINALLAKPVSYDGRPCLVRFEMVMCSSHVHMMDWTVESIFRPIFLVYPAVFLGRHDDLWGLHKTDGVLWRLNCTQFASMHLLRPFQKCS